MEAKEKRGLTVQELCDKLTNLCHEGHAKAIVRHCVDFSIRDVGNVGMIGEETAMISSKGEL